jgi:Zn ribbon nucleic-acid-binding protein/archaellum biogenesis ATPase FlaH
MAAFKHHTSCPKCNSSDALAVYVDESSHCFSCGFTKPSEEFLEANQDKKIKKKGKTKVQENKEVKQEIVDKNEKPIVTEEQTAELKSRTVIQGSGYRGIRDNILAAFGVRTEYDDVTSELKAVYYPCTQKGTLTGWKPRVHPKTFGGSIGRTGATCDLFGQFKFNNPAKVCLVVGGEHDVLAAYQMLQDYVKSKGNDYDTPVVSPTIGETGSAKQLAAQYSWFDKFDKIILGYDNDKAGKEATEKAVAVLPKGKVFIAHWSLKDPNEMLEKGKEKAFISDYFNAKSYVPAGVLGSDELYERIVSQSAQMKVPFPPFLNKLNDMLGGGLSLGHAYTCSGVTGGGKTSLVNEMVYYWLFNSPYKVGVVSMELNAGQYGEVLLSRHIQQKIAKLNHDEKTLLLESDKTKQLAKDLFETNDGASRFMLIDDRDSSMEQLQTVIEQMIIGSDVKIIIIDPWSDCLDGMSNEEQALANKWIKSCIKSHGVSFFLVNHVRKSQGGGKSDQSAGGKISESDIMGSSTTMKSASANILLMRNKEAEDVIERNTTKISLAKNRLLGLTGNAGSVYYDFETHTLHDLDEWLTNN